MTAPTPIIIAGSQRSGTTLMGQILGAHPKAMLFDEPDGLYAWTKAALHRTRPEAAIRRRRVARVARRNYLEPERRVGRLGSLRSDISHLVLKGPNLTFEFEAIGERWPHARVVWMYRDIRAIVGSAMSIKVPIADRNLAVIRATPTLRELYADDLARLDALGPEPPAHLRMAMVAKMKMSTVDEFRRVGVPVFDVVYEELVQDLDRHVGHLLDHVGLEFADECLAHETVLTGVGPGGTSRSREVDASSLRRWHDRLGDREADEIWELVGDYLETLGYER